MKLVKNYAIIWVPLLFLAAALLFYDKAVNLADYVGHLLSCKFYLATGLFCPGCGATRSVLALLRGDFLLSLRCNPTTIGLVLVTVLWYIELVAAKFGKKLKLFPRNLIFWAVVLGLVILWGIVRNFVPFLQPPNSEPPAFDLLNYLFGI